MLFSGIFFLYIFNGVCWMSLPPCSNDCRTCKNCCCYWCITYRYYCFLYNYKYMYIYVYNICIYTYIEFLETLAIYCQLWRKDFHFITLNWYCTEFTSYIGLEILNLIFFPFVQGWCTVLSMQGFIYVGLISKTNKLFLK